VSTAVNQTSNYRILTQICNCSSIDINANCTSIVQTIISPTIEILGCTCSNAYTGSIDLHYICVIFFKYLIAKTF